MKIKQAGFADGLDMGESKRGFKGESFWPEHTDRVSNDWDGITTERAY